MIERCNESVPYAGYGWISIPISPSSPIFCIPELRVGKEKKILSMLNNKDEDQVLERRIVYANMSARRRRKICSNTRP